MDKDLRLMLMGIPQSYELTDCKNIIVVQSSKYTLGLWQLFLGHYLQSPHSANYQAHALMKALKV